MAVHVAAGATGRTSPRAGDDLAHLSAPELVARYQQGDRRALVELVPRMRESVIGHIAHHLSDPSEVEDLAHDVLAHALAHLDAIDPDRGLWPWLVAMANNRIIDHHRQYDTASTRVDDVRVRETLVPSTRARAEDAFDTVELREQRRTLFRMLRHLAPRQRAALVLHAVHGWDADQIAELLGTNRNNVHQLLSRARGRARREYLVLTGGHRPWAVVPWPLLWARDRIRRALQRTRDAVTEWQGALPAAGESMTTAASMAVAVAVMAGLSVVNGPPPAADAAPGLPLEPVSDGGVLDGLAFNSVATGHEDLADGDLAAVRSASGRPVAGAPPGDTDSMPTDGDGEPAASIEPPPVDAEPTVETTAETSGSDRYEDGQQLDVEADVKLDPDDGETGGNATYQTNCASTAGAVQCDVLEGTEGDPTFEHTEEQAEEASAIKVDSDESTAGDAASETQDDAEQFDVLTDDNCSLDDGTQTACESADDPAV